MIHGAVHQINYWTKYLHIKNFSDSCRDLFISTITETSAMDALPDTVIRKFYIKLCICLKRESCKEMQLGKMKKIKKITILNVNKQFMQGS